MTLTVVTAAAAVAVATITQKELMSAAGVVAALANAVLRSRDQ